MANRAHLASLCRKTKMCKFFLANGCDRGVLCAYAHSENEIRSLPDLKCTQLCPIVSRGELCTDGRCKYAHRSAELKIFPSSNSHGALANREPGTGGLKLTQLSLAAMAAQHAVTPPPVMTNDEPLRSTQDSFILLNQELCALKQAQAAIDRALADLEDQLRSSSYQSCQGSQKPVLASSAEFELCSLKKKALSDQSTIECDSDSAEAKSCQQESDSTGDVFGRQLSWADMFEECELDMDGAAPDFGTSHSREVIGCLGRGVSYKRQVDMDRSSPDRSIDATVAPISTSIAKNTGKEYISTFCPASRSDPEFDSFGSSGSESTSNTKVNYASNKSQLATKRRTQAMRSKPAHSSRQGLQAPGPLPAGLVQPGAIQAGR
eukprot:TRINITY_DN16908_c0_g1_i1.p1 TRINITY_DN16908_c0_g1~~TRINITY_DN16908_c0_g1_i1.p1  ORF type:complete len:378 (+),score=66.54 TRINITY_DN16908_c0_g1_i1:147-1280(+)